ncbi:MAG TPA: VOC family protein [Acetobacteraceae bacterium]|nr:VOC family protein [Acetobacteraceae bacterium]
MSNGAAGFGLRFHHLGLAVPAPEAAMVFLGALGYTAGAAGFDPLQNVHLAIRHHPTMPDVEVIWPGDGPSPIDRMIRRGHMIYHLCYVTEDATASLDAMTAAGLEVAPLGPATPAVLFGGVPVSFHSVDQLGLIELIHGEPRTGGAA